MKKIFVTLEKVCNFASDYGYLGTSLWRVYQNLFDRQPREGTN